MGDLTGIWNIYSQRIGSDAVFTARATSVDIDTNNKSARGFALAKAESVTFTPSGNDYYLGVSDSYRYRAHIRESNGLRLLVGHVATIEEYLDGTYMNPHRCVFVGLPTPKASIGRIDTIRVPMVRIPLFHNTTTRHKNGTIEISRSGKSVLLNGTNPRPFEIKADKNIDEGIHIFSEKTIDNKIDTLEAWIILGPGSQPICVGYHNWRLVDEDEFMGPPTSERCTKGIIGW